MSLSENFNKYVILFTKKEDLIQKYVIDQGDYFFDRLEETIENKNLEKFYLNIVCSTIADGYDLFMSILKNTNYLKRNKCISETKGRRLYKLAAVYHTAKYNCFENLSLDNIEKLKQNVFDIFDFSKKDKKIFNKFFYFDVNAESEFEVEFARTSTKYLTDEENNSTLYLSYVNNFLNHSHREFLKSYNAYLGNKQEILLY